MISIAILCDELEQNIFLSVTKKYVYLILIINRF